MNDLSVDDLWDAWRFLGKTVSLCRMCAGTQVEQACLLQLQHLPSTATTNNSPLVRYWVYQASPERNSQAG